MNIHDKLSEKCKTQEVYLMNILEGAAVRLLPGPNADSFAKFKGMKEYKVSSSSCIVTDAFLEAKEITKKRYYELTRT